MSIEPRYQIQIVCATVPRALKSFEGKLPHYFPTEKIGDAPAVYKDIGRTTLETGAYLEQVPPFLLPLRSSYCQFQTKVVEGYATSPTSTNVGVSFRLLTYEAGTAQDYPTVMWYSVA